jgi:DnaJ-domain-containing protein 1
MRVLLFWILGLLYTLFPGDFDWIPVLGWIDDALVWWMLYRFLIAGHESSPEREHRTHSRKRSRRPEKEGTADSDPAWASRPPRSPREVLGVSPAASREEIRRAYRALANKYHPDKVSHLGDEFRELAEARFKEIQEAYRRLTE